MFVAFHGHIKHNISKYKNWRSEDLKKAKVNNRATHDQINIPKKGIFKAGMRLEPWRGEGFLRIGLLNQYILYIYTQSKSQALCTFPLIEYS